MTATDTVRVEKTPKTVLSNSLHKRQYKPPVGDVRNNKLNLSDS